MNAPQIIKCQQNSPEWLRARQGIPTASAFSDVLAKGEGKVRRTYMMKLAGEIITGEPMEGFSNSSMERGHAMEAEARDLYAFQTGAQLDRVGFVRNGRVGCSPDSLIGDDGGVEIKTTFPHLLIDLILKDEFPAAHKAQVQGTLWVTGRQWWDIVVYWPNMPMFVKRTHRDEVFIQTLAAEIDRFNSDLDAVVAQMRRRIDSDALPEFAAAAA
jgi:YqaJ-like recombinase protein